MRTPRSSNRRASVRCTIVAPTCDLMSSPTIGRSRLFEALVPVVLAGDEHGDAVDKAAAGLEHLLDVPLGGLLGADREVGDDHVGVRVLEDLHDVGGLARGLRDLLLEVFAEAVVGHPAIHGHAEALARHLGELHRVVLPGPDRLAEVLADLRLVDVEGGGELDVAHVVAAEVDVHQAGDVLRRGRRRGSSGRPARTPRRSCRRRRSRRGPCPTGSARRRCVEAPFGGVPCCCGGCLLLAAARCRGRRVTPSPPGGPGTTPRGRVGHTAGWDSSRAHVGRCAGRR